MGSPIRSYRKTRFLLSKGNNKGDFGLPFFMEEFLRFIFFMFFIFLLALCIPNDIYSQKKIKTNDLMIRPIVVEPIPWYDDDVFINIDVVVPMFDTIIPFVLKHEGSRFVHDKTIKEVSRRGITLSTYRSFYGKGNMNSIRYLSEEKAKSIYRKLFWSNNNLDSIVAIGYPKTAAVLMDSEINIGPNRANKFLQRIIALPYGKRTGRIDSLTLEYIRILDMTDERLANALLSKRRYYYARLVKKNDVYAKYHRGWNRRLNSMSKFIEEI